MNTVEKMENKYTYKGKYYFVESSCDMKDPSSRGWYPAVIYVSLETGQRYCRRESEFYEKFKACV